MLQRVQRRRVKGFKLPPKTICASRPSKLENPYRVGQYYRGIYTTRSRAVELFREYVEKKNLTPLILRLCADKDYVACWCGASEPCHTDVIVEIVNTHRKTD